MFEVGTKVIATENNDEFDKGTPGVITDVDLSDCKYPFFVEFPDEDGDPCETWCRENEVEADGEVIE
jgi:hypothetical protein